jgi:hypothetical protein
MVLDLNYEDRVSDNKSKSINLETTQHESYWNKKPNLSESKKVSYDDILSSLNLVVSTDGILRRMSSKNSNTYVDPYKHEKQLNEPSKPSPSQFKPARFNSNSENTIDVKNIAINATHKLDPGLKNSAIYNKYFKNYKDSTEEYIPPKPVTLEELRQQLIQEKMNNIYQKKRVSQIKSRQLNLTSNLGPVKPRQQGYDNHLFNFSKPHK